MHPRRQCLIMVILLVSSIMLLLMTMAATTDLMMAGSDEDKMMILSCCFALNHLHVLRHLRFARIPPWDLVWEGTHESECWTFRL